MFQDTEIPHPFNPLLFCLTALLNSQLLADALATNGHRWSVAQLTHQNALLKSSLKQYLNCMQQI